MQGTGVKSITIFNMEGMKDLTSLYRKPQQLFISRPTDEYLISVF